MITMNIWTTSLMLLGFIVALILALILVIIILSIIKELIIRPIQNAKRRRYMRRNYPNKFI